mgnify:CR=1 FL=1
MLSKKAYLKYKENKISHSNQQNSTEELLDKNDIYYLSKRWVYSLFIWYVFLMLIGLIAASLVLLNVNKNTSTENILLYTIIISLAMSGMLSGVRYTQKLYKVCIFNSIIEDDESLKQTGSVAYYILRPLFAMVFSIIVVVGILGGFTGVSGNLDYFINEKFVYLSAIVSSMVGISVGDVLDKFLEHSKEKINKL